MLSGVALFFATATANAVDSTKPAVDGVNGKLEALGGVYAKKGLYGVAGSLAVPLGGQFGAQVDGAIGSFDERAMGAMAGHFSGAIRRKRCSAFMPTIRAGTSSAASTSQPVT